MSDAAQVSSTSDQRVVNNVMRHNYRVLNDTEKAAMQAVKDKGLLFVQFLHDVGGTRELFDSGVDGRHASRELSVAQTKMEEAVMWAVKHITR